MFWLLLKMPTSFQSWRSEHLTQKRWTILDMYSIQVALKPQATLLIIEPTWRSLWRKTSDVPSMVWVTYSAGLSLFSLASQPRCHHGREVTALKALRTAQNRAQHFVVSARYGLFINTSIIEERRPRRPWDGGMWLSSRVHIFAEVKR